MGKRAGAVSEVPYIEMLPEDNARQGFFREDHFRSVLNHANALLKDVLVVAFYTGWRIESILNLEWRQVDLKQGSFGLYPNQTKNKKSTIFPLAPFPELSAILESRHAMTEELEKSKRMLIPYVFHRDGGKVRSIRTAWENTRLNAGVPGGLIHDFRRTAVRNLKRMGFSDSDIMNMVGFKTMSIMQRYDITTEQDILDKGAEIAQRVAKKM